MATATCTARAFCSADQAEHELRESLGLLESDTTARHLKMRIGRSRSTGTGIASRSDSRRDSSSRSRPRRCYSFRRPPWESSNFSKSGDFSDAAHDRFNQRVNEHFEGTRDYIVTHYKTNSRKDTDYWRANAANLNISEPLKACYNRWMAGNSIVARSQALAAPGLPGLLLVLHHGRHGHIPGPAEPCDPRAAARSKFSMAEIDNLLTRSATNFRDQRSCCSPIPPRRKEESLQIYFW